MALSKDKKKLFIPDQRKVILTVVLTSLTYLYLLTAIRVEAPAVYQQPVFLKIFGFPTFDWLLDKLNLSIAIALPIALLSPIIIWYLVSCIVFFVWDTVKGKFRI